MILLAARIVNKILTFVNLNYAKQKRGQTSVWHEIAMGFCVSIVFVSIVICVSFKLSRNGKSSHETLYELEAVRLLKRMPFPIWVRGENGQLIYANQQYQKSVEALSCLQDVDFSAELSTRISASLSQNGETALFDITSINLGTCMAYYALNVTETITAKNAERDFVQSLAKTFAHLSTGIAVFGKTRQLEYFNPALIELTSLPIDVIGAKPTVFSFFEHLRGKRIMPEQKQFVTWRQKVEEALKDIETGTYQDLWTLPDGSVYRITGRLHSDDAIAIFLEDVSSEIILSRRLKSNIGLYNSVFDGLESAILVFSQDGKSVFENSFYLELWVGSNSGMVQNSLSQEMEIWRNSTGSSDLNERLATAVLTDTRRTKWCFDLTLKNGLRYKLVIKRVSGGLIMTKWTPIAQVLADFDAVEKKSVA